ncbi:ABC transporter ATP-binding protein [Paenibacillus glycanilyticus]|uniref:ABC transporter ATP-binding protein n=1 Tax=Paenibacillus glycanilyticus TaxID=126569 RepID=A0ABQ6GAG9_9BACL|nr:ABC transporter ATP-binding protein [Paenibacillus glycanilyticus]GLX66662.1 ABC transporter ATP-binding protein [Paenibacillus glycanilyticus]
MELIREMKPLFAYILPWKRSYASSSIVVSVSSYFENLIMALLLGKVLGAVTNGTYQAAITDMIRYASMYVLLLIIVAVSNAVANRDAERATKSMRLKAFSGILTSKLSAIASKHAGDTLVRLDGDVNAASEVFKKTIQNASGLLFTLIASIVTVFSVSWLSGIILTLLGLLMLWINVKFIAPARVRHSIARAQVSKSVMGLSDLLTNAEMLRFYGGKSVMLDQYEHVCRELQSKKVAAVRLTALQNTLGQVQASFVVCFSIGIGFILWRNEVITIEQIPILMNMGSMLVNPLAGIGFMMANMQSSLTSGVRVLELMDLQQEEGVTTDEQTVPLEPSNAIVCRQLSFGYKDRKVLDNVSFALPAGKMLAIVGESGSGKSTLLKLLLGLYEYEGSLSLLGKEISDTPLANLRDKTAYVPQDCPLFEGTIFDNIALGRQDASEEDVYLAASRAGVSEFAEHFQDGFQTWVGESGVKLSGGQRQKISIARALLKEAPILLFDEITSSIDAISEQYIQDTIERIKGHQTIVVVAHRLATIKEADCILVMDKGALVEMGTHEELLDKDGYYARLKRLQDLVIEGMVG